MDDPELTDLYERFGLYPTTVGVLNDLGFDSSTSFSLLTKQSIDNEKELATLPLAQRLCVAAAAEQLRKKIHTSSPSTSAAGASTTTSTSQSTAESEQITQLWQQLGHQDPSSSAPTNPPPIGGHPPIPPGPSGTQEGPRGSSQKLVK